MKKSKTPDSKSRSVAQSAPVEEVIVPIYSDDLHAPIECVLKNDVPRLIRSFENDQDQFHEQINEMINERDENGKSALDLAAILSRIEILRELVARGAQINASENSGSTALHLSAAWGKIDSIKALVELGADLHQTNSSHETPRQVALRYSKTECVDYLDWAAAKQALIQAIQTMKDTMADPEKVQGRLNRDDKTLINTACTTRLDWIEKTPEATTEQYIQELKSFEETIEPIMTKLAEPPPEKIEKK